MTVYDETEILHYIDNEHLSGEIIRINDLRRQIEDLKAEKDILTERVAKELAAEGHRTVGVATPQGERIRATVTQTPTKQVNLVQLREINPDLYRKITKTVLDATALNRELNKGNFSETELHCVSVTYSRPFLRFSDVNGHAEEE